MKMAGRRAVEDVPAATLDVPAPWATASVGPNNKLLVYSGADYMRPQDSSENRALTGGCRPETSSVVCELAWSSDVFNEATSKLVCEAQAIFLKLQEVGRVPSTNRSSSLLHLSRQYRAVIHACVLDLRRQSELCLDDVPLCSQTSQQQEFAEQAQLFASMELVWHLCEVLLLEVVPAGCVIQPLLEWIGWHCSHAEKLAREILTMPNPSEHRRYWEAVQLMVLHGRVDVARSLLLSWPGRKPGVNNPCGSLEELLRKMPIPQALFGRSLTEFSLRWKRWHQECLSRLESGHFAAAAQLEHIAKMLVGDADALKECAKFCKSWYEHLVGQLLYTNPTIKAVDLQFSVAAALDKPSPLDEILKLIMEFDVHTAIKQCSVVLAPLSWWFSAHLTDLLHHCGKMEVYHVDYGTDLREFLLLEFATSLMSHSPLWQVGATYFDHCPMMGRPHLELLIERIPLTSERKAAKVLSVCQQRGMTEQVHSICRVMAMKSLQQGRLGTALNWCLQSKDSKLASFLADKLLSQYSEQGIFEHLDIIDNLGSLMLLNDRLTFLAKYREFHHLYNEEKYKEAGQLLFSLLDSRLAPFEFWPTILLDALPLLEMEKVIFNSEETYELMYCLEEVQTSKKEKAIIAADPDAMQTDESVLFQKNERLNLLHLVLARNLAKAILAQAS